MIEQNVSLSLKRFLLIEQCLPAWKELDLYLFRDDAVVFYVGQSHFAFARVWEHLMSGFKGHSIVGRFVWCNWPISMKFTIELLSSRSEQFAPTGNDVSAAERQLIQQCSPCFNISQNTQPTPIPPSYLPPNARLRCHRSFRKLLYEAERAVQAEERKLWIEEAS
jgi:hypothetical protein